MGRRASKAKKNIYYLARIRAAQDKPEFSSREKASDLLGIERSRLARIELDKVEPYPEEVLFMAKAYKAPYLCNEYCNNICPIGVDRLVGDKIKNVKPDSLERLSLRFISSANSVDNISRRLADISKDGVITDEEYEDFRRALRFMNELAEDIRSVKAYIMADPELKSRFAEDLKI